MKKLAILGLVLVIGLVAQPAIAGKKKGPKPWKSEQGTIGVAHPVFYTSSQSVNSITAKEFESGCALPASNGLDGYVFEVPAEYQKIQASLAAVGAGAGTPAGYDLDVFMYDANCAVTFVSQATGTDEQSVMPKGTAFVFVNNYLGEPELPVHLELKAYKL